MFFVEEIIYNHRGYIWDTNRSFLLCNSIFYDMMFIKIERGQDMTLIYEKKNVII